MMMMMMIGTFENSINLIIIIIASVIFFCLFGIKTFSKKPSQMKMASVRHRRRKKIKNLSLREIIIICQDLFDYVIIIVGIFFFHRVIIYQSFVWKRMRKGLMLYKCRIVGNIFSPPPPEKKRKKFNKNKSSAFFFTPRECGNVYVCVCVRSLSCQ